MNTELEKYNIDDLKLAREQFQSWLAALRSGEYPQTRDALRDCHGYCCLGVLADIQLVKAGESQWEHRHGAWELQGSVLSFQNSIPGTVMDYRLQRVLMDLNDEDELCFGQIADELEAHFMPLFKAESN